MSSTTCLASSTIDGARKWVVPGATLLVMSVIGLVSLQHHDQSTNLWVAPTRAVEATRSMGLAVRTGAPGSKHGAREAGASSMAAPAVGQSQQVADVIGLQAQEAVPATSPAQVSLFLAVAVVLLAATRKVMTWTHHRSQAEQIALCAVTSENAAVAPARAWTNKDWNWSPEPGRTFRINYTTLGNGPKAVVLVHGFGADVNNWRAVIPYISEKYTVYAIDLLGYGSSEKPKGYPMSIDQWARQVTDFVTEFVGTETEFVVIGNSIGSLVSVTAAGDTMNSDARHTFDNLKGVLLFNCAGGMNNKLKSPKPLSLSSTWDEWLILLLSPVLALLDALLKTESFANWVFERTKTTENVSQTLKNIYTNPDRVDDELVADILRPSEDDGAIDVFVATLTGDPGRGPVELVPSIRPDVKVGVLWGIEDKFTPAFGPIARYFAEQAESNSKQFQFERINGGHVLHDDVPETAKPWLGKSLDWIFEG